jgi:hypothetical protein
MRVMPVTPAHPERSANRDELGISNADPRVSELNKCWPGGVQDAGREDHAIQAPYDARNGVLPVRGVGRRNAKVLACVTSKARDPVASRVTWRKSWREANRVACNGHRHALLGDRRAAQPHERRTPLV